MDQRERIPDIIESLRAMLDGHAIEQWTTLPGIIQDFDVDTCTCSVKSAVKGIVRNSDGTVNDVELPIMIKVPVMFPRGGDYIITFPVTQGDECLIIFSCRCIDEWWRQGGIQRQTSLRVHDLHDGFVIVGVFSQPTVFASIKPDTLQIRNKNGDSYIEMADGGAIKIVAPGGLSISGTLTSDSEGTFNGHTVGQHVHSNPEGGVVGPPQG
jgi:hypothetical protein